MSPQSPALRRAGRPTSLGFDRGYGRREGWVRPLATLLTTVSLGFFVAVVTVSQLDPGYFERLLLAGMQSELDTVATGSTAKGDDASVRPIPVPVVVRDKPLRPEDFQVVMIFGAEAHLASPGELWRVKVGSIVPALGTILAIEASREGGSVKGTSATLTLVRN